jgi:surface protein
MDSMFNGCSSLEFLDIYSFDMKNVTSANNIFAGLEKLNYINIYHVENSGNFLKTSSFSGISSLIVCQKEKILINSTQLTIVDKCCYYDAESGGCDPEATNYMVVYFGKNTEYSDGEGFAKGFREGIKFIINNDYTSKKTGTDKLNIQEGNKLEIYFSSITNLQNFFDVSKDPNVKNIISIDLSNLDTSLVKNFDYMFSGCSSLESIDFTNFNTSLAESMVSMFAGCDSLQSINLSNFDTSGVTSMNNMFSGCKSLENIDLSPFNTSSVKEMNSMFEGCSKLQFFDLSHFDTSNLTKINSLFSNCASLTVLDMSSFDMKNIEDYENMFNLVDLRYVNLYEAKNFKAADVLNKMENLMVCQKENIIKNENITKKCCYYDLLKERCISSSYILINYGEDTTYENGFGLESAKSRIANTFRTSTTEYFIINGDYNKKLNSKDKLNIKAGKKLLIYFLTDVTTMENYFNSEIDPNTKNIVSIDLSQFNGSRVNNMAKLFYGCESLESIFPLDSAEDSFYFNTSLVTNMSSMFYGCGNLSSLFLSDFETSLVKDMKSMFYGCASLESIDLSSFNTTSVTNMNSIFSGCSSLKILDLSLFDISNVNNMSNMFSGCKLLKYLDISGFNTERFTNNTEFNDLFNETNDLSYINIFDFKDNEEKLFSNILSEGWDEWQNLTVCQKEKLITKGVINSECCYYNVTSEKCEPSNYIAIYLADNANYENGFAFNVTGEELREGIDFIIYGNHDKKIQGNETLNIRKGTKVEIHFSSDITSLENYFSTDIDPNMENLISVDFTHFNFSSVTNMSKLFYGCNSLKTVLLYYGDTQKVTDMSSMLEGCSSLEVLDLSNIDTSSVTDMSSIFSGCESLKILDISNFNMENINKADTMFVNVTNITYINLYDTKNAKKNIYLKVN